jgi:hypothetical protein
MSAPGDNRSLADSLAYPDPTGYPTGKKDDLPGTRGCILASREELGQKRGIGSEIL